MRLTSLPQTLIHESLARRTGPARRLSSDELMIATKFIRFTRPLFVRLGNYQYLLSLHSLPNIIQLCVLGRSSLKAMRSSTRLLAPGLAKRSLDEFKRFAKIGARDPFPASSTQQSYRG